MHLRRKITTNGKLKQKDHSFKEILYDYFQNILYMVVLLGIPRNFHLVLREYFLSACTIIGTYLSFP